MIRTSRLVPVAAAVFAGVMLVSAGPVGAAHGQEKASHIVPRAQAEEQAATASPEANALASVAVKAKAPARKNSKSRTVIFIHGFQPTQKTDCYDTWKPTIDFFKRQGWKKQNLITWGYYKKNTHCTSKYDGTTNSDLGNVSEALRKYIKKNFTDKGKTVDVVAHSTGGLIIRNAIIQSHLSAGDLFVEDVVTLGTPHEGSKWGNACNATQCKQLRPDSSYIKGLNYFSTKAKRYHEADGGTNWTLVGSHFDVVVPVDSATSKAVYAKHRIRYPRNQKIAHVDYYSTKNGGTEGWTYYRSNDYGKSYHKVTRSAGPIRMAYRGAYYHSKW